MGTTATGSPFRRTGKGAPLPAQAPPEQRLGIPGSAPYRWQHIDPPSRKAPTMDLEQLEATIRRSVYRCREGVVSENVATDIILGAVSAHLATVLPGGTPAERRAAVHRERTDIGNIGERKRVP